MRPPRSLTAVQDRSTPSVARSYITLSMPAPCGVRGARAIAERLQRRGRRAESQFGTICKPIMAQTGRTEEKTPTPLTVSLPVPGIKISFSVSEPPAVVLIVEPVDSVVSSPSVCGQPGGQQPRRHGGHPMTQFSRTAQGIIAIAPVLYVIAGAALCHQFCAVGCGRLR
jgi:hypothetical protein